MPQVSKIIKNKNKRVFPVFWVRKRDPPSPKPKNQVLGKKSYPNWKKIVPLVYFLVGFLIFGCRLGLKKFWWQFWCELRPNGWNEKEVVVVVLLLLLELLITPLFELKGMGGTIWWWWWWIEPLFEPLLDPWKLAEEDASMFWWYGGKLNCW